MGVQEIIQPDQIRFNSLNVADNSKLVVWFKISFKYYIPIIHVPFIWFFSWCLSVRNSRSTCSSRSST